jgi:hypothetical protein
MTEFFFDSNNSQKSWLGITHPLTLSSPGFHAFGLPYFLFWLAFLLRLRFCDVWRISRLALAGKSCCITVINKVEP